MKKILLFIVLLLFLCACNNSKKELDVSDLIEDDWFDYSYFIENGKDENQEDVYIITFYWSKVNESGKTVYVSDSKKFELQQETNLHGLELTYQDLDMKTIAIKTIEFENNIHEITVYRQYGTGYLKEVYVFQGEYNGDLIFYNIETYEKKGS